MRIHHTVLSLLAAVSVTVPTGLPAANAAAPLNATMTYAVHPGTLTPYAAIVSRKGQVTIRNLTAAQHTFKIKNLSQTIAASGQASWAATSFALTEPVTIQDGAISGQTIGTVTTIAPTA